MRRMLDEKQKVGVPKALP